MSVHRWAYEEWKCEGDFCIGDCDLCQKADWVRDDSEIEEDGFITNPEYMVAKPSRECVFPKCEECESYADFNGEMHCTVPMVISKQDWLMWSDTVDKIKDKLDDHDYWITTLLGKSE